ncbi:MAG: tRNA (N6-isopentenyl adenosine(37)-C2)-methylthiotransferase MiaB [Lachnospiraceae bacterium]|nr:tRNA (N6-isopentenyl adenosine(37)-C2)-methylthiotransferase MiaB [Lachnospiraceae bacterium]
MNAFRDTDYGIYTSTFPHAPEEEAAAQHDALTEAADIVAGLSEEKGRRLTACVVTFGCQMNARDSEKISGVLAEAGYELTEDEEADLVIYNTCTVRDNANQRVYGRLGHLNAMKKKDPGKRIGLCGCMMQEVAVIELIKQKYGFVDLIFGTHNIFKFPELLLKMLKSDRMIVDVWRDTDRVSEELPLRRKYPFKSGINIMFGCDNYCTYCIVPYVRGRERSRAAKDIIREAERLASEGVSEIMLLGQNVNSYAGGLSFAQLLKEVCGVNGIERVRFMTSHPKDLSEELISVMATEEKICSHLHLPVQSGSTEVLRRMNRKYSREDYLKLVERIRTAMPDISLTTDIIVGFPTETPADVEDTVSLIKAVEYDNAFTFIYSPRSSTPAAEMIPVMTKEEIQAGFDRVLTAVQELAVKRAQRFAGRTETALCEETDTKDESMMTGRLSGNMIVHFPKGNHKPGDYVKVRLTECRGFYYIGET